jgi:hypothetical protein
MTQYATQSLIAPPALCDAFANVGYVGVVSFIEPSPTPGHTPGWLPLILILAECRRAT